MRDLVINKIILIRNKLLVHNFKETGLLVMINHEINEKKLKSLDDETLLEVFEEMLSGLEECDYVSEKNSMGGKR